MWDFRDQKEKRVSKHFRENGYIVENGDIQYIDLLKKQTLNHFFDFQKSICHIADDTVRLNEAHLYIEKNESNNLRLYIMKEINRTPKFNKNYYLAAKSIIHTLCGNELAMQKKAGISINLPNNKNDVLPIHADTWNGVSPFELNIWIPMVDCKKSMCLYLLTKEAYVERLKSSKKLLQMSSDKLYEELKTDLKLIEVKYGEIMAFDQSLPHGYMLNEENSTHWSFNCRFKGLHTPYWDKKLGDYFMPITVKACTMIGINYQHPNEWL